MKPITPCCDPSAEYSDALPKCTSFTELHALLHRFAPLVPDAIAAAPENAEEFATFTAGLRKERRKQFSGEDFINRYGAVLLPEIFLHVGLIALRCRVPWGLAFLRLKDAGQITCDENGVYHLARRTHPKTQHEEPTL